MVWPRDPDQLEDPGASLILSHSSGYTCASTPRSWTKTRYAPGLTSVTEKLIDSVKSGSASTSSDAYHRLPALHEVHVDAAQRPFVAWATLASTRRAGVETVLSSGLTDERYRVSRVDRDHGALCLPFEGDARTSTGPAGRPDCESRKSPMPRPKPAKRRFAGVVLVAPLRDDSAKG